MNATSMKDNEFNKTKLIKSKNWQEQIGETINKELRWQGSKLIIEVSYGGNDHVFKKSILDTSSKVQKSYTIVIQDRNANDRREVLTKTSIVVDLTDYAEKGTVFKIVQVYPKGISEIKKGYVRGEITFNGS